MSETLNVNVLVAAKEEYSKQLINCIQPGIYNILLSIFEDSQKKNIRLNVSYSNFQKELKSVPHWADYKLEEKLNSINKKFPYLMDLITAIFVSHVKILACVRLKTDDKSVKIKVPSLNSFLHKIIVSCCEQIYYNPQSIHDDKAKILIVINECIHETIANQIPIEYILNEYLSGAFDEPDTKYPENNHITEDKPDEPDEPDEDLSDEEEFQPEDKEIPIIPISKPVHFKATEKMTTNNNVEEPKPDSNTKEEDDIENINELKSIEPDTDITVNKKYDISDDDETDEESDNESDNEEETDVKENTLF